MTATTLPGRARTPIDQPAPLSVDARRRLLCEIADLYVSERSYGGTRPVEDGLPSLLHPLRGWAVPLDEAVRLFEEFAAARTVLSTADTAWSEWSAADDRAERLLDELLGETPISGAAVTPVAAAPAPSGGCAR